jgi:hypothetical protein
MNRCPPLLIRLLLEQQRKQFELQSLGSLADSDDAGRLPLHLAAAADPVKLNFVLPEVASKLTTVVELVLQSYPPAATVVDLTGRLPLHYLLFSQCGHHDSHGSQATVTPSTVLALVRAYPEALLVQDPVSGLYPVQQLACSSDISNNSSSHLEDDANNLSMTIRETNLVYRLLRACPDVVNYHRNHQSTHDGVWVH